MVRMRGLEPPRLAAPDPKSGVSANFTTSASLYGSVSKHFLKHYKWYARQDSNLRPTA